MPDPRRGARGPRGSRGFSLLEMVVAMAILAMSLGVMYQAAGGATRNVAVDERTAYAVELARSLLANHAVVPIDGFSDAGETSGGFAWRVDASPVALADESLLAQGRLQQIDIAVSWRDGDRERRFALASVVAGREEAF